MNRLIAASIAAVAITACGAYAQPERVRQDVTVHYGDLDLSTESGARIMLARIEQAADKACRNHHPRNPDQPRTGSLLKDMRICHEAAVAEAVASLRVPTVSRLYAQSRGQYPNRYAGR